MDWLNRNVRLTKSIAGSALEQTQHLKGTSRTTQQQAARSLDALSKRIRGPLTGLDAKTPQHGQLLDYGLLTQTDISELEELARAVSGEAVRYAGKAAVSLRKIMSLIEEAHRINRVTGWMPNPNQVRDWQTAMDAGPNMLEALEGECQSIAVG